MHASLTLTATMLAGLAIAGCGGGSDASASRATPTADASGGAAPPQQAKASTASAPSQAGNGAAPTAAPAATVTAAPAPAPAAGTATAAASDAAASPPAGDADAPPAGHPELSTRTYAPDGQLVDLGKDLANNTGFVDHWLVLGPFPNPGGRDTLDDPSPDFDKAEPNFRKDFLVASGGEAGVVPKLGDAVTADKVSYSWEQLVAPSGETIDIRQHYETSQRAFLHTIAYIADYIQVDEAKKVSFGVGSDDGYMLWVNGEFVTKHHIHRGVTLDDDFVPVSLRKGINLLLFKVDTDLAGWGALVRIVGKDYAEVHGIKEYALPAPSGGAASATAAATQQDSTPAAH